METIYEIKDIKKNYGDLKVLQGISLTIEKGKVYAVIGPSGSGKSTLLRCLNLLEEPDEGEILYHGEPIFGKNEKGKWKTLLKEKELNAYREKVGMVFQQFNLFANLSVKENVALAPIHHKRMGKEEAEELAISLLKQVGVDSKANERPHNLSGGQKQRVAIARCLAMKPELILFDEPTSALDPEMVKGVLEVIKDLAKQGHTMIIVTHEMGFCKEVADEVIFMDDGIIGEIGSAKEVFSEPKNPRLKSFLDAVIS